MHETNTGDVLNGGILASIFSMENICLTVRVLVRRNGPYFRIIGTSGLFGDPSISNQFRIAIGKI